MYTWIDQGLEKIRQFLVACDRWIPVPLLEYLVDIPQGDENALFALAREYRHAADLYGEHVRVLAPLVQDLARGWDGEDARGAVASLQAYLDRTERTAQAFAQMSEQVHEAALRIEAAKIMDLVNLAFLAWVLYGIIVSLGTASLAGVAAITSCRQAIRATFNELVAKLGELTVRSAASMAVSRGVSFAGFTAATKLGTYGIQALEGHDPTFNGREFVMETVDAAIVGAVGGPLTLGVHNPLTEGLAMAGGAVVDNIIAGQLWDPGRDLTAGVAQGALFGAAMGTKGLGEKLDEAVSNRIMGDSVNAEQIGPRPLQVDTRQTSAEPNRMATDPDVNNYTSTGAVDRSTTAADRNVGAADRGATAVEPRTTVTDADVPDAAAGPNIEVAPRDYTQRLGGSRVEAPAGAVAVEPTLTDGRVSAVAGGDTPAAGGSHVSAANGDTAVGGGSHVATVGGDTTGATGDTRVSPVAGDGGAGGARVPGLGDGGRAAVGADAPTEAAGREPLSAPRESTAAGPTGTAGAGLGAADRAPVPERASGAGDDAPRPSAASAGSDAQSQKTVVGDTRFLGGGESRPANPRPADSRFVDPRQADLREGDHEGTRPKSVDPAGEESARPHETALEQDPTEPPKVGEPTEQPKTGEPPDPVNDKESSGSSSEHEPSDSLNDHEPVADRTPTSSWRGSEELRATVDSGVLSSREIVNNEYSIVNRVEYNNGVALFEKIGGDSGQASPKDQAYAELLASMLGQKIGAPVPQVLLVETEAVHENSATYEADKVYTVYMEEARGKTGLWLLDKAPDEAQRNTELAAESDKGRLLGVLDVLTNNEDRHEGNWLLDGTSPTGIDHALSWSESTDPYKPPHVWGEDDSPFCRHFLDFRPDDTVGWAENDLSPADIGSLRQRLAELRKDFVDAGYEDWWDFASERLDILAEHATGTRDRIR